MVGKACQLIPAYFDAEPQFWDRFYSKNMRPIRGYPDYWRIIDTESFVDGPPAQGANYSEELFIWRANVVLDENVGPTNTIEVRNLRERLSFSSQEVNGETVTTYDFTSLAPDFTYTHTDVIDSVSLEFDQSGRRTFAFESAGEVFLYWFDSTVSASIVTNWGAGHTPVIVTDTYNRTSQTGQSDRLLFYVKDSTQQIVYRRQLDRYGVEYTLPNAPNNVVEIIKASKNIYGGLTVLYCYDNGSGNLISSSFTARDFVDGVNLGTDGDLSEEVNITAPSGGTVNNFLLKLSRITLDNLDTDNTSMTLVSDSGGLNNFLLKSSRITLDTLDTDNTSMTLVSNSGGLNNFLLKLSRITIDTLDTDSTSTTLVSNSGGLGNFTLEFARINIDSALDTESTSTTLVSNSGGLGDFFLG